MALHLSFNPKQEYSEMCGFVQKEMSLEIVRSKTFLLRVIRDKEEPISQWTNMANGVVMVMIALWSR